LQSPTYCKPCFAAIAAEELSEDTARLHELDHYWAMHSGLKHTVGTCARCEKDGEVVYHEAAND
jgi:hypothetical protein